MHHRFRLGDLVVAAGEADGLPFPSGGPQHLVDALAVVGDQGIGRLKDRGGRAVILFQLHHGAGGRVVGPVAKISLEAHQDLEIGGAEAVDALVRIPHHKHGAIPPVLDLVWLLAISHQELQELVLGAVGVLIFIHQHVAEPPVPVAADLPVLPQELHRQEEEIIEIQGVVGRQSAAVVPVGLRHLAIPLPVRLGFQLVGQPALVFGVADGPAHFLGLKALRIQPELLGDDLLHQALGVVFVVDGELSCPTQPVGVVVFVDVKAQQPREEGVEGADPEVFDHLPVDAAAQLLLFHQGKGGPGLAELALGKGLGQQHLQPLLHFPGSLVGEGHRQEGRRVDAVMADQVGDAMGEGPGFAAACPGYH